MALHLRETSLGAIAARHGNQGSDTHWLAWLWWACCFVDALDEAASSDSTIEGFFSRRPDRTAPTCTAAIFEIDELWITSLVAGVAMHSAGQGRQSTIPRPDLQHPLFNDTADALLRSDKKDSEDCHGSTS
jgi:hypothetical protein